MAFWGPINKIAGSGAKLAGRGLLSAAKAIGTGSLPFMPAVGTAALGIGRGVLSVGGTIAGAGLGASILLARGARYTPFNAQRQTPIFANDIWGATDHAAFQLSQGMQNKLFWGGMGVGAAAGAAAGALSTKHPGYQAEMSPSGMMEVTRPDMLGATGDLPLALHRRK
jgi:hypothetical protein